MTEDLAIFGCGGMARETHQLVEDLNQDPKRWNVLGFLDEDRDNHGTQVHDLPVLGDGSWLEQRGDVHVAVAIGNTSAKYRICRHVRGSGHDRFATLIAPGARVGNRVTIGTGTIICAGSSVMTDLTIGDFVILNVNCTVSHDATLGDFTTVAPGVNISGAVDIGEGCDLGAGATLIQGVRVGAWSVLGAGSVAVRDIPPNVTAVGVPAEVIKERPVGWQKCP